MRMPPRADQLRADRRRILELLAGYPEGPTDALLIARGFKAEMVAPMSDAGLAIAKAGRMVAAPEGRLRRCTYSVASRCDARSRSRGRRAHVGPD